MVNSQNSIKAKIPTLAYHAAQDPVSELDDVRGPRDARAFLDLSLSQIAALIPDTTAVLEHHIDRSTYCRWESGTRKPHINQVRIVERLLADAITREMAYDKMLDEPERRFTVRIEVGKSRWIVKAFTTCTKCKRLYHITRRDSRRCKRCIARSKATR